MVTSEQLESYQPTIGIECHVQFNTATKLFAAVSNDDRDKAPNTTVSPLCFGLPGTLPVLNEKAVELAVKAGYALNAQITKISSFDRKHYFYPDLPKGYQITQLERPIVGPGSINVPLGEGQVTVRIHHAHLEEDAGKSTHPSGADYSLVDLNRAGTPLLEIVSEADIHSAAEAKAYAQELYLLMKYAGVTHGDLQHGNMRFDVNVSVAKKTATQWGTRAEVKNLNSFRSVERAVEYEVKRQIELLEKGQVIVQETRGWDDAKQRTTSQRSKEEAQDYRYFPEPDVPPIVLDDAQLQQWKAEMPLLPPALRTQLTSKGVDQSTAETLLLRDAMTGTTYVSTLLALDQPDAVTFAANYMANRDISLAEAAIKDGIDIGAVPSAAQFQAVNQLRLDGALSSNNVDALLFKLRTNPTADPSQLAEALGFLQENDTAALSGIIDDVLANPANQKAINDAKNGEMKVIGFLIGQTMKASNGKANPGVVSKLIRQQLGL